MFVKIILVVFALTLNVYQTKARIVDERSQTRFLGTLNRYYISSRSLLDDGFDYYDLANDQNAINGLDISGTQNVAIVIHGRNSTAFSEFGISVRNAFINSDPELVVIAVDWPLVSSLDYATVVNSVPFVADDIIALINQMAILGKIDRSLVHIVGYDVGAHIAGIVSRDQRARVQRITGLSPAGESWLGNPRCLRSTDADYVEVIHTDYAGDSALGIAANIGTVDFFANSGTSQPGCSDNQCNHSRAWQLFAATLDMGGHLMGLKCEDSAAMEENRCVNAPALALGTNDLSKIGSGIYRVNTGSEYPYNA